jgi:hypothetical protein
MAKIQFDTSKKAEETLKEVNKVIVLNDLTDLRAKATQVNFALELLGNIMKNYEIDYIEILQEKK